MSNNFENNREVVAHLADGGSIRDTCSGNIIYMSEDGILCVQGKAGRMIIEQIYYKDVERYTEPNKYTLDVWFNKHPNPILFNDGKSAYLFGQSAEWNSTYGSGYNKKYRITVEEVRE